MKRCRCGESLEELREPKLHVDECGNVVGVLVSMEVAVIHIHLLLCLVSLR